MKEGTESKTVLIELVKPSDKSTSEPLEFTFLPRGQTAPTASQSCSPAPEMPWQERKAPHLQQTSHPYIPNVPNHPYPQQQAYPHHLGGNHVQHNLYGQDGRSPRQVHQPELCGFQGDLNEKNQVRTESSISFQVFFLIKLLCLRVKLEARVT